MLAVGNRHGPGQLRAGIRSRRTVVPGVLVAALAAPSAAQGGVGGSAPAAPPSVRAVTCLRGCTDLDGHAAAGATVRITGRHLADARSVAFLGAPQTGDEVSTRPRRALPSRLDVRVPEGARTGPVRVLGAYGHASAPSPAPLAIEPPSGPRAPRPALDSSPLVDAEVSSARVLFFGSRRAELTYTLNTPAPSDVRVDLVRVADLRAVASWTAADVAPGEPRRVRWNGYTRRGVPRAGRYEFRVTVLSATAPLTVRSGDLARTRGTAATEEAVRAGSFSFLPDVFPVRGRHDYGAAGARFGAGRGGRGHQGHDVFARCGTPLVAARGGRVKFRGFHAAAGHYLVIDGAGTPVDSVYMHLTAPALVRKGEKVLTGQRIGSVGDSGNARGCHLHFELWGGRGWYTGGSPIDPLPPLRAWDRVS